MVKWEKGQTLWADGVVRAKLGPIKSQTRKGRDHCCWMRREELELQPQGYSRADPVPGSPRAPYFLTMATPGTEDTRPGNPQGTAL